MASLPPSAPLTVTELNRRSRQILENQFGLVWVVGEISRATLASSGHWYFVLKDEGAAIDCAMFKGRAQYLDFKPENGLKVEVRARVTVYEPRGAYQLAVEQMRHAGLGALFDAFEKLKARLVDGDPGPDLHLQAVLRLEVQVLRPALEHGAVDRRPLVLEDEIPVPGGGEGGPRDLPDHPNEAELVLQNLPGAAVEFRDGKGRGGRQAGHGAAS
jgi:OB-fold nucleic acid binding domain